jgi:hypothetical protein
VNNPTGHHGRVIRWGRISSEFKYCDLTPA